MGISAAHSCSMFFEDMRVPAKNLLGKEGEGFKVAMTTLDGGRIGIAAQALGIARAAFEEALRYSGERKTFGKPIRDHQAIQFMLADMATEIDAARLLVLQAALLKDKGVRHSVESAMAKLYAVRDGQPRGQQGPADPRRHGLQQGDGRRAPRARRAHHRDLRRDERDPAHRHLGQRAQGVSA